MSDLTRDEIRAASEAVGWEWEFCSKCWLDSSGTYRFPPELEEDRGWMDAIALLEAWCGQTAEGHHRGWSNLRDEKGAHLVAVWDYPEGQRAKSWMSEDEADLHTAAVRAVNRAAEQPPQDKETA